MKKLPVAGPTYDFKLENIRNSIIEEELANCVRKRENIYLDENVMLKYTAADGTEYTFGQVTEDTVSLQTDVTTLQSQYTTLDGETTANASAISGLETRVTDNEGDITANATSITSLQTSMTTANGNITANSSAINTLDSRVTTAEGNITAQASDITTLQSDLSTAEGDITANASAVSSLTTRVTTAEGNITAQASDITTLQSDLSALDTDVTANASAVSTLQTEVSVIDGEVTAISSDVTSLTTTVGDNTTDITTNASSINGIEGKYAVKINNNGHVSGFGLISTANNATPTSTFTVTADAFKIVDTSGSATPTSPFEVYTTSRTVDGVTVPAGVYMENANITAANIKTLDVDVINLDGVTLDTSGGQLIVKDAGIDTGQLANNSVSNAERQYVGTATYTGNNSVNDVASVTINANVGDKFAVIGRIGFFTFSSGWSTSWPTTVAISFTNQTWSDATNFIYPHNSATMEGKTLGGIFTATQSGSQTVKLRVASGTSGGTVNYTVNACSINVQRLQR